MLSAPLKRLLVFVASRPIVVQHTLAAFVLTGCCAALFFHRLGERALWSSHEGRAGQHAQWMLDTGDWGMPRLYCGVVDYQKPPLYYWLVAWVARARGGVVDEWAVRLPAALCALGTVWLVYGVASVVWRPSSGFMAALIVIANFRFSWLARVGRIDMPLTLVITTVLVAFFMAYRRTNGFDMAERARRGWGCMTWAYLAGGAAVMFKGPVGLVLPLVSIMAFLAMERRAIWPWQRGWLKLMHCLGAWWGLPLVLAVCAPWFIWATIATRGEFFEVFFVHHNWDRTLGVDGLKPEPFWYYVPRLLVDVFPWSLFIPAALYASMRRVTDLDGRLLRFSAACLIGMFALLSLVRFKRHDYLLPLVPFVALLVAGYWSQLVVANERQVRRSGRAVRWLVPAAVAAMALAVLTMDAPRLAREVARPGSMQSVLHSTDQMIVSALADTLGSRHGGFAGVAVALFFAIFASSVAFAWRQQVAAVAFYCLAWVVAFRAVTDAVLPVLEPLREQRSLARQAREFQPDGAKLYYYGREDQQLMFYLGTGSTWLTGRDKFRPVITQAEPVFVLVELDRLEQRQRDWPEVHMVPLTANIDNRFGAHRDPVVLVTNEPGRRLVQARWDMARPVGN